MDKLILKKVLPLDSLINFLDWEARAEIHLYTDNGSIASKKVLTAYKWILKENWEPPKMKYGQDRLIYFYHPKYDCWFVDEDYLKLFPQYKEQLIKLKYL